MTDRELLESLVKEVKVLSKEVQGLSEDVKEVKASLKRIEPKLDLTYNHTAKLTEDLESLRKETEQGFSRQTEAIQALVDMYGQHEFELAKLRRKPV